jgi:hypothetical protein
MATDGESTMQSLVSLYVPLTNNPRSIIEYVNNGQRLLDLKLPTVLYIDTNVAHLLTFYPDQYWNPFTLEDCWLSPYKKYVRNVMSQNPQKDTFDYHALQHMKTSVALEACNHFNLDHALYIDFGWRWSLDELPAAYERLSKTTALHIPGAYNISENRNHDVTLSQVDWYFLGGLFGGPVSEIAPMDAASKSSAYYHLAVCNTVTWEVNTWARAKDNFEFKRYSAHHQSSMISEFAKEKS